VRFGAKYGRGEPRRRNTLQVSHMVANDSAPDKDGGHDADNAYGHKDDPAELFDDDPPEYDPAAIEDPPEPGTAVEDTTDDADEQDGDESDGDLIDSMGGSHDVSHIDDGIQPDTVSLSGPVDESSIESVTNASRGAVRDAVEDADGDLQPVPAGAPDETGEPETLVAVHGRVVRVDRSESKFGETATVIVADESGAARIYVGTHGAGDAEIDAFDAAEGEEVLIDGLAHADSHRPAEYAATGVTDVVVVAESLHPAGKYLREPSVMDQLARVFDRADTIAAARDEIADAIMSAYRIVTPYTESDGEDKTWIYIDGEDRAKHGIWVPGGIDRIKSMLADALPPSKNTTKHRREIGKLVFHRSRVPAGEFANGVPADADLKWVVGVENGVIDLRTGELHDHGPEWRLRSKLPVAYHPDEYDELGDGIDWFLDDVCGSAEDREMCLAMAAHSLMRNHDIKSVYPLIGPTNSGKSKWEGIVRRLVGEDNVASMDFDTFAAGEGFETGKVRDVHFVIDDDASAKVAGDLNYLKKVSGGQEVGTNAKYQALQDYRPYSTVAWISNNPAILGDDKGGGLRSRIYPIVFPHKHSDDDDQHKDKIPARELEDRIYTDSELEALLVAAVEKAGEMYESGNPGGTRTEDERWELYNEWADDAHRFAESMLTETVGAKLRKDAVYEVYVSWCEWEGLDPMSKTNFWTALRKDPEVSFEAGKWDGGKRAVNHVMLTDDAVEYAPEWVIEEYRDEIAGEPATNAHERRTRIADLDPGPTGPVEGQVIESRSVSVDWKEIPHGCRDAGRLLRLQDETGRIDVIALDPDGDADGALADVRLGDEVRIDAATGVRSRRGVRIDATTAEVSITEKGPRHTGEQDGLDTETPDGDASDEPDGDEVQDTTTTTTAARGTQADRIETLIETVNDLDDEDNGAPMDAVLDTVADAGYDRGTVEEDLNQLRREGTAYQPAGGMVRTTIEPGDV
jgi:P4 family phage/plasmid primase-like protien